MSKRRILTPEFNAPVALEEFTGVKDRAGICRDYRLKPQVFSRWREEFLERAPEIFATEPSRGDQQDPTRSAGGIANVLTASPGLDISAYST